MLYLEKMKWCASSSHGNC